MNDPTQTEVPASIKDKIRIAQETINEFRQDPRSYATLRVKLDGLLETFRDLNDYADEVLETDPSLEDKPATVAVLLAADILALAEQHEPEDRLQLLAMLLAMATIESVGLMTRGFIQEEDT